MGRFLIWLSSADQELLRRCPTERAKYLGIGGAILFTATMAALSMGYALHSVLHAPWAGAAGFGLFWGLLVANLDRLLVAAMRRRRSFWQNLGAFLPRFALAVLFGVVIAEPLVLRAFAQEIGAEVEVMETDAAAARDEQLSSDPRFARIPTLEARAGELRGVLDGDVDSAAVMADAQVADLADRLAKVDDELAFAEQAVICEDEGTCGSGRPGEGPAYREKVALRDRLQAEHDQLANEFAAAKAAVTQRLATAGDEARRAAAAELADVERQLDSLQARRDAEQASFDTANGSADGLLARVEALHRLSGRNAALGSAAWSLRLLLIAVDSMAVLVKFLMILGPVTLYESLLKKKEADTEQLVAAEIDDAHTMIRLEAQAPLVESEVRAELDKQLAEDLAHKTAAAQGRVYDFLVGEWEQRQLDAIAADIDAYIT